MKYWLIFLLFGLASSSFAQEEWTPEFTEIGQTFVEKYELGESLCYPFKLQGGLILVEACLDDQANQFLLDSGAPSLFVNEKVEKSSSNLAAVGMNGTIDIAEKGIGSFQMGNIFQVGIQAYQLDISHLEKVKACKLGGIIGYDQIKDHEILVDYKNEELQIVKPGRTLYNPKIKLLSCIPFELKGHFAVVEVNIDGRTYQFGLDTGAETNVLDRRMYGQLKRKAVRKQHEIAVRGIDQQKQMVSKCQIKSIDVGGQKYTDLNFVYSDLTYLNKAYDIQLDGLLGYPFLKSFLYSLNYSDQEFCLWEPISGYKFETQITKKNPKK